MTIEELKKRSAFNSYIVVDEDVFKGLIDLRKFSEKAFQGWMACSSEEYKTKYNFVELISSYIDMIEKLSEPLEKTEDDQG